MPTAWVGAVDDAAFTIVDGISDGKQLGGYEAPKEISFCQQVVNGHDGAGQSISLNGFPPAAGGVAANGADAGMVNMVDPARPASWSIRRALFKQNKKG